MPDDIDEDYAKQLVSEVRVVDGATGKPQWVQKSRANHYLDCEALAMAIGYSLNVQRIPDGVLRERTRLSLHDDADDRRRSANRPQRSRSATRCSCDAGPASRFAGLSSRLNR